MIVVGSLIRGEFTTRRFLEWRDTPGLDWICRVYPCPLSRGKDLLVLPVDASGPEGPRVVDAASVADSIVHDEEGIRKRDKLR
jgi:hypothetical protein